MLQLTEDFETQQQVSQASSYNQELQQLQQLEQLEQQISVMSLHKYYRKQQISRYQIKYDKILGKGSFSKVYSANDYQDKNFEAAIKIINKSIITPQLKQLIDSQISILRSINHPNVIKYYQTIQNQQNIYIVMQLCDKDLQQIVSEKGFLTEQQAIPIIKDVFKGLYYLSTINIVHRDLKLANIFLKDNKAKISDFGFAKFNKQNNHFNDINIGSPVYMSPEAINQNLYGPTTDVWAFGIFIYELLHGKTPYSHCTTQKQLKYNIANPLNWNSLKGTLSYSLKQLILKCLQVKYQKRITFDKLTRLPIFKNLIIKQKSKIKLNEVNIIKNQRTLQKHNKYTNFQTNTNDKNSYIQESLADKLIEQYKFTFNSKNNCTYQDNSSKNPLFQQPLTYNINRNQLQKDYMLQLQFPVNNLECYNYLIEFCYVIKSLQEAFSNLPHLKYIKLYLQNLYFSIFYGLNDKIKLLKYDFFTFLKSVKTCFEGQKIQKFNKDLKKGEIQVTKKQNIWSIDLIIQKQLRKQIFSQNKNRFKHTSVFIRQLGSELNRLLKNMLRNKIDENIIKIIFIGHVFLVHFKQIIQNFTQNNSKYWFQYSLNSLNKQILKDKKIMLQSMTLQSYVKQKRKLYSRKT